MLYVLLGEDDFSLRQSLEEIKRDIGDQTVLTTNTAVLDGQRMTLEQLRVASETVPFLAEKRLVIVEGLLRRFEPGGRPGQKTKTRLPDQRSEYKSIAEYIRQIPDFTTLVLVDGKINSRNPLLNGLSAEAKMRRFPLMRGAELHQWIQRRVAEAGGSITSQAVDLLAKFVGSNLWVMANEIDKLVLFAEGRPIEEGEVRTVVSYAQEANVFVMVDAILEFRAGSAGQLLRQLLQQGAAPAYLLVMLSRQTRMMVRVKELRKQRKSRIEIQNKLGLTHDFVLRKAWEQADRYSLGRLKEVYHKLLEADLSIKTGRFDGELALDVLIAELSQRGAASAN